MNAPQQHAALTRPTSVAVCAQFDRPGRFVGYRTIQPNPTQTYHCRYVIITEAQGAGWEDGQRKAWQRFYALGPAEQRRRIHAEVARMKRAGCWFGHKWWRPS